MAIYRTIKLTFWNDPFTESLTSTEKLLYLYLFTSPHTDNLGILEVTRRKISSETGIEEKEVNKIIDNLVSQDKLMVDGYKILVVRFIKNQTDISPNVVKGLVNLYTKEESLLIKRRLFNEYQFVFEGLSVPSQNDIDLQAPSSPFKPLQTYEVELEVELEDEDEIEIEDKERDIVIRKEKRNDCPHSEIVNLYHETLPSLPKVVVWNDKRKALLRQRWVEDINRQSLGWWRNYFLLVSRSDFLTGQVENLKGGSPFLASLEWLIKPSNIVKVLEGNYNNRKAMNIYQKAAMKGYDECAKEAYGGFEFIEIDTTVDILDGGVLENG